MNNRKRYIKTKFKRGDIVELTAKNSLFEGCYFEILNRRIKDKIVEYRLTDKIVTIWAREEHLQLVNEKIKILTGVEI